MGEGAIAIFALALLTVPVLTVAGEIAYFLVKRQQWRPTLRSRRVVQWALILIGVFALGFFAATGVVAQRWEAILLFEAVAYIALGATVSIAPGWAAVDESR